MRNVSHELIPVYAECLRRVDLVERSLRDHNEFVQGVVDLLVVNPSSAYKLKVFDQIVKLVGLLVEIVFLFRRIVGKFKLFGEVEELFKRRSDLTLNEDE